MAKQEQRLLAPYIVSERERANGDLDMVCPLHDDERRSATINFREGIWNCHAGCGGGLVKDLVAMRSEWVDPPPAGAPGFSTGHSTRTASPQVKHPLPDPARLGGYSARLEAAEAVMEFLEDQRGLSLESIQRYGLGWNGRKYVLPIYAEDGKLVNVRYYQPDAKPKWINEKGYGSPARLFPIDVIIDNDHLFWCEGELDAILTNQNGIPAFTATGGAKIVWQPEWNEQLAGKHITLCFDRDREGQNAIRRVRPHLKMVANSVSVCKLPYPITDKHGKDLTDFWLDGGTSDKLYSYCDSEDAPEHAKYQPLRYERLHDKSTLNKPVAVEGTVASVEGPFLLMPSNVHADCDKNWKPVACSICPVGKRNGEFNQAIAPEDDLQLDLVQNQKREQINKLISKHIGIPGGCPKVNLSWDSVTAWHGEVRNGSNHAADAMPILMFEEHAPQMGVTLSFKGQVKVKGRQSSILVAAEAERVDTELDKFQLSAAQVWGIREVMANLPIDGDATDPRRQLDAIARLTEDYVTRRFGQRWLHIATDLVYHSVLQFPFNDELLHRGWLELLAVGETRVGKSSTLKNYSDWYERGEIVPCEKISIPGLISTTEKRGTRGDQWVARVGKFPLLDRQLITLDEAQGLSPDDIGKLSDARSAGIIKVTQASVLETQARVRLIWLANPREGNQKGVQALESLMGKTEDLARIDLPMYLVQDMSPEDEERWNSDPPDIATNPLRQHLMQALLDWAWSRKPEDIVWGPGTKTLIIQIADHMANKYHSHVPFMPKNEARVRLARLAVAIAARLFSTDNQGRIVKVLQKHVKAAGWVYANLFKSETLGYTIITREARLTEEAALQYAEEMVEFLKETPELVDMVRGAYIDSRQLGQLIGLEDARYQLQKLVHMRAVTTVLGGYEVNNWARTIAQEYTR